MLIRYQKCVLGENKGKAFFQMAVSCFPKIEFQPSLFVQMNEKTINILNVSINLIKQCLNGAVVKMKAVFLSK